MGPSVINLSVTIGSGSARRRLPAPLADYSIDRSGAKLESRGEVADVYARADGRRPGRIAGMVPPRPRSSASRSRVIAPAVAASLALLAVLTGARGVDLAAATYRVELFARQGLTLWDSQWYGGHWTFDYSVLFAPIGWLAGIPVMEIVCVAAAAWAFDRLAVARFGRAGRAGAIAFAVGTVVQVAIGQEPYLLGETLALVALVAAVAKRRPLSLVLAVASALATPLTGAFIAMIAAAWAISSWPDRRWDVVALGLAGFLPVVVIEVLFPGQGTMPFPTINYLGMLGAIMPDRHCSQLAARARDRGDRRAVRDRTDVRLRGPERGRQQHHPAGDLLRPRARRHARLGRAALGRARPARGRRDPPSLLAQWVPAAKPLLGFANPSLRVAYFQPLLRFLREHDRPLGRVEVVPTALPLGGRPRRRRTVPARARLGACQLDTANNPIFYDPLKPPAASCRAWLFANGVRFVALPDAGLLDYAATCTRRVIVARRQVPGLRDGLAPTFATGGSTRSAAPPGSSAALAHGSWAPTAPTSALRRPPPRRGRGARALRRGVARRAGRRDDQPRARGLDPAGGRTTGPDRAADRALERCGASSARLRRGHAETPQHVAGCWLGWTRRPGSGVLAWVDGGAGERGVGGWTVGRGERGVRRWTVGRGERGVGPRWTGGPGSGVLAWVDGWARGGRAGWAWRMPWRVQMSARTVIAASRLWGLRCLLGPPAAGLRGLLAALRGVGLGGRGARGAGCRLGWTVGRGERGVGLGVS